MKKTQYYLIDTSVVLAGAVVSELHKVLLLFLSNDSFWIVVFCLQ